MEDDSVAAAAEAVIQQQQQMVRKEDPRIGVIKGHVQKLVAYLQHAQTKGCFTLEQASQVYAILLAVKNS